MDFNAILETVTGMFGDIDLPAVVETITDLVGNIDFEEIIGYVTAAIEWIVSLVG